MRKVIELYQLARIPNFYHPRIRRGRSHSISGKVEDLMAIFLGFNLPESFEMYVDQPIRLVEIEKTIYPDITLIKDGEITNFLDVKTDLAFNRDGLPVFCDDKQKLMIRVRKGIQARWRDGITKKESYIRVSRKCSYHILIISGKNISQAKLNSVLDDAKVYEPDVTVYVLSGGVHPNEYGSAQEQILGKLKINHDAFDNLFGRLQLTNDQKDKTL